MKLIRTTFWTRKLPDKRADESDDYTQTEKNQFSPADTELEDMNSKVNIIDSKLDDLDTSRKSKIWNILLDVVCGFERLENKINDTARLAKQQAIETQRKIDSFYSLNQTKFEKIILGINLAIILTIAVGLYIFFSIPPQYHMFKDIYGNQTIFPYFNLTSV